MEFLTGLFIGVSIMFVICGGIIIVLLAILNDLKEKDHES